MSTSRRKKGSIPGRFSNPPKRLTPDAKFVIELSAEEREYLKGWERSYLEQIPNAEREHLITKNARETLREILQRVSPGAQDPNYLPLAVKVRLIFGGLHKLDNHLVGGLLAPVNDGLREHFGVATVDQPTETHFNEFVTHLRQTWSRATVNALVAHTALCPVPAQGFAVEEMLRIQEVRENGGEAALDTIEFPLSDVTQMDVTSQTPESREELDLTPDSDTSVPEVNEDKANSTSSSDAVHLDSGSSDAALEFEGELDSSVDSSDESQQDDELTVTEIHDVKTNANPTTPTQDSLPEPIEVPDIYDLIYTPLGRMLISQAIASADGRQIGALSQEDYAVMLEEFVSLNIDHRPTWFQAGFASALGLVPKDYLLDSRALNASRKQYYVWGYIKGLVRSNRTEDIREVCLQDWPLIMSMFLDDIGQDIVLEISREMIYANLDYAEALLNITPRMAVRGLEHEIQLLQMLDTESVQMLRVGESWRAARILKIAEHRLSHLINHSALPANYLRSLKQLQIGIRMGLAASYRISGDFSTAKTVLAEVPTEHLQVSSPRTRARYFIQRALSESDTKRIEDVVLPRTQQDRSVFKKKFAPAVRYLNEAAKQSSDNADTDYFAAAFALAELSFEQASSLMGRARLGYGDRQDRQLLLPQLKLQQALINFHLKDYGGIFEAIDELLQNEYNWKLRTEEAELVVTATLEAMPSELPRLIEWLSRQLDGSTLLSKSTLEAVFAAAPATLSHIALMTRRLSNQVDRMSILLPLLGDAILRSAPDDIEMVLDQIDDLRGKHSPEAHKMWAKYCRTNQSFREYLGTFEADLSAISSFTEVAEKTELEEMLISVLEGMLPIQDFESEGNFAQLLQQLESIAPEYADFFQDDPRTKAPTSYTRWSKSQAATAANPSTPVTVLFVGGNPERQNEINRDAKSEVERMFNGDVHVEFHVPGWGSSWMDTIHKIERQLPTTDAVGVMPLTRTTFGRTLRRKLNDVHVPRISCTAEGKASTIRAVEEAVRVARKLRGESG